ESPKACLSFSVGGAGLSVFLDSDSRQFLGWLWDERPRPAMTTGKGIAGRRVEGMEWTVEGVPQTGRACPEIVVGHRKPTIIEDRVAGHRPQFPPCFLFLGKAGDVHAPGRTGCHVA